jgi:hypothetical protein
MSGWQARAVSLGCVHKAMPNDRVGSKGCVRTVQSSIMGTAHTPIVGRTVPGRPECRAAAGWRSSADLGRGTIAGRQKLPLLPSEAAGA